MKHPSNWSVLQIRADRFPTSLTWGARRDEFVKIGISSTFLCPMPGSLIFEEYVCENPYLITSLFA